jgi:hypothetical protein
MNYIYGGLLCLGAICAVSVTILIAGECYLTLRDDFHEGYCND